MFLAAKSQRIEMKHLIVVGYFECVLLSNRKKYICRGWKANKVYMVVEHSSHFCCASQRMPFFSLFPYNFEYVSVKTIIIHFLGTLWILSCCSPQAPGHCQSRLNFIFCPTKGWISRTHTIIIKQSFWKVRNRPGTEEKILNSFCIRREVCAKWKDKIKKASW